MKIPAWLRSLIPVMVFSCLALIFVWQIGFMQDTLKWDALDAFLPWRRAVTESLRSGHLPFWNPYQYLGFPIHSDPECGAWYPVVWFIALLRSYDFCAQNLEFCFHLFIAGWGAWKLAKGLAQHPVAAYLAGISFMACGFFVGNAQNFIFLIGPAWFPLALYYLRKALIGGKISSVLKTALVVYMIVSGSYPGCTIIALYGLMTYAAYFLITRRLSSSLNLKRTVFYLTMLVTITVLCTAVVWMSIYEALPYFSRSGPIPYELVSENPFPIKGYISFLLPFATSGLEGYDWGSANCMINTYMGLVPLFLIVLWVFTKGKTRQEWTLSILALLLLGIAAGSALPLRYWLYRFVPGMDLFRHPAIFRAFAILALLLLAGFRMSRMIKKINESKRTIYILYGIFALVFTAIILYNLPGNPVHILELCWKDYLHPALHPVLSVSNCIFIQALIQLVIILALGLTIYFSKHKTRVLICFVALDLFFSVQLNMNSTVQAGTCTDSFAVREQALEKTAEAEIPYNNKLISENEPGGLGVHVDGLWRNLNMLCKQPFYEGYNSFQFSSTQKYGQSRFFKTGMKNRLLYLSVNVDKLASMEDSVSVPARPDNLYVESLDKIQKDNFWRFGNAFFKAQTDTVSEISIHPNEISATVEVQMNPILTLMQNYHTDWKVFVDGKDETKRLFVSNHCLISLVMGPGTHRVRFVYSPLKSKMAFYISLWTIAVSVLAIALIGIRKR
ncbi:MAG: hypothetical protein ACHQRM_14285 [Bacteroidia bacterium]